MGKQSKQRKHALGRAKIALRGIIGQTEKYYNDTRMTRVRTALTTAPDHSRRCTRRTLRISAQIPRQLHMPSKTGIPIRTKMKFGAMGVDSIETKSSGNPIAIHTGQSVFTRDACSVSTTYPIAQKPEASCKLHTRPLYIVKRMLAKRSWR